MKARAALKQLFEGCPHKENDRKQLFVSGRYLSAGLGQAQRLKEIEMTLLSDRRARARD